MYFLPFEDIIMEKEDFCDTEWDQYFTVEN